LDDNVLADVIARGQTLVRADLDQPEYAEEPRLRELGLRSRVVAPLSIGARTIGLISVGRRERDAFLEHEVELKRLLGPLVADVLDTSRIEAGTFSYRFTDVDLGAVVRDAVATASLAQDEVRIDLELAPVPTVRGDVERLRQVVANLVDNAVKYSPEGAEV